ncbi:hypothetical protein chiPu_0013856 [Chiloscyllium punctatum]|uniref:Uncharacterized protein n=1 Tax=Chiloscyllium punctatum TaxID=137246 RepID=A0A401SYB8_CHIPU|nr:hypothetical protein [Chiloscyllium punctatum]
MMGGASAMGRGDWRRWRRCKGRRTEKAGPKVTDMKTPSRKDNKLDVAALTKKANSGGASRELDISG